MKKRLVSFAMALVFLCMMFSSCGKTETPEREMSISQPDPVLWRGLLFYSARSVENDENSTTLKYRSFKSEETVGAPVYSDLFVEGGNPFKVTGIISILVDEEATEKNDGIPVLLAALPSGMMENGEESHRIVSYNMANGKMEVLCDNIGNSLISFALYGDRIYYTQFTGEYGAMIEKPEGEALFSFPRSGGKPEEIPLSIEGARFDFKCSNKGKIYFETEGPGRIYSYDVTDGTTRLLGKFEKKNQPLCYDGEKVYYRGNVRSISTEDGKDLTVYDLYSQPLESMKDFTEENGEQVLRELAYYPLSDGKKIYYESAADGDPVSTVLTNHSILRWYDTETKESGIVFDYSAGGEFIKCFLINDNYLFLVSFNGGKHFLTDWKTGEQRKIEDLSWSWK